MGEETAEPAGRPRRERRRPDREAEVAEQMRANLLKRKARQRALRDTNQKDS